jgi:hypothetical protein
LRKSRALKRRITTDWIGLDVARNHGNERGDKPLFLCAHSEETPMTKSRYGLLAGIAGAAAAVAWYWRSRTDWVARKMSSSSLQHE